MRMLSGKVALVTGAGSGIGAATARLFAEQGAKVALLGCWAGEIEAVARDIASRGGTALPLWANVAIAQDVTDAMEKLASEWGQLDILFSNAGVNGTWAPLEELSEAEWDEPMEVNLRGTFLVTKAALPLLKVRGGAIVITSSVNGTRMFSMSGATAYACSKAALLTFAKMAAVELARHRIRVNAVCPGFIDSQIHERTERRHLEGLGRPVEFPEGPIPLTGHRAGQPEQVARQVLFLASDAADHITGTEVYIDGAQSLLQG